MITIHRLLPLSMLATLAILLSGCGADKQTQAPPAPQAITSSSIGHYCSMNLDEHTGPKGQILLRDNPQPVWFTTIRQVFSYTLLPEEPKAIRAIYVQDMGQAPKDGAPPADAWIEARTAHYLIESRYIGGMGVPDALPFFKEADALAFSQDYGGRVVAFGDMPEDYILSYNEPLFPSLNTDQPFAGAQQ